ncbi:polysaccharide biosynthesis/export family protein [Pedobacter sp. MW01-1-1]|uniref:polysaccharide biosynthesis/export family protein n=1 Tax=Pedobacter sp. MW01-1-1 TaxID=3383027 RepID=UPI003FF146D0
MPKSTLSFICLLLTLLLFSCSIRKEKTLFNAPTDIITDTLKQVYVINDQGISDGYYKIKPSDLLAIRNLQNQEFGATGATTVSSESTKVSFLVDLDGNVTLPAIGKVDVNGLTRREAAIKIQGLYKEKLLKDPIIDVSIINLKVTLFGEFSRQGNFLLEKDNTTLIDILGEAGGVTKNADIKTVKIIRGDRSNPEIIYVNLNNINSLASKKLILQNNDIIYIQPTKSSAFADKTQSISVYLQPVLVLVNLALLALAIAK